jgi:hypothetical protein
MTRDFGYSLEEAEKEGSRVVLPSFSASLKGGSKSPGKIAVESLRQLVSLTFSALFVLFFEQTL